MTTMHPRTTVACTSTSPPNLASAEPLGARWLSASLEVSANVNCGLWGASWGAGGEILNAQTTHHVFRDRVR